ncbi:MAG TPA: hypothetical protein VF614_04795, partial [Chthoniobacteraceae bacterium]
MPKVLLLTAGYGEGHNAAARGLQAAFALTGAEAEIVDLFALTGGSFYEHSRRGYLEMINRAPNIWAGVYSLIDKIPLVPMTMPLLGKMRRALEKLIADTNPIAIISVYPVYGYVLDKLYPRGQGRNFDLHTVVTDSITINSVWHRCTSDTFLVPNEDTARVMREAGVAPEKLHVLGFPVPPK